MADLFIIAAGRGSRMGGNVPKALVPIIDEPCLTTTLQQIGNKFTNVFIIANVFVKEEWYTYQERTIETYPELMKNVKILFINSGLGDGHALMHGIEKAKNENLLHTDDIVVCWGDVFFTNAEIINELLNCELNCSGIVPARKEQNPYVTLLTNDNMHCVSADFSKYGESHQIGFHDLSVFRFDAYSILSALTTLHTSLWKNGRYISQGGELSTLYSFHYLYNIGQPVIVYESDYETLSFNTIEEVANIQKEIDIKWKHTFRKN